MAFAAGKLEHFIQMKKCDLHEGTDLSIFFKRVVL